VLEVVFTRTSRRPVSLPPIGRTWPHEDQLRSEGGRLVHQVQDASAARTRKVEDGLLVDVDGGGRLVGIEIIGMKGRNPHPRAGRIILDLRGADPSPRAHSRSLKKVHLR